MKIVYKISLFFAVLLSVSACKLDQYPTDSFNVPDSEEAFSSYLDAKNFANGLNSYFRAHLYGRFAETADLQGDLFNASSTYGNVGGPVHTMSAQFTASDYYIRDVWNGYYQGIVQYNLYIHNVDHVYKVSEVSADERAQMELWRGWAHFYRAYAYFELSKKFCDTYKASSAVSSLGLPIIGKFDVNQKPARATLQATMDSIEMDLNKAATLLKNAAGVARAITPTIDAVNALKARFYLWIGQYDKAIDAADGLIKNTTYALAKTEQEMKAEFYTDNGPEDIMQMFATLTEGPRQISAYIGQDVAGQLDEETYVYTFQDFLPTQTLVDFYGVNDTRGKVFISELAVYIGNGKYTNLISLVKYRGNPALSANPYFSCYNKPKVFRIAEMYLIKAEAEVLSGAGDPKTTLNTLQAARGAALTTGTLGDVQTEWARETVGEGMRIECLKRWGIIFTERPPQEKNLPYINKGTGFTTDVPVELYKYTWPIPTTDIVFNDNLVQNPRW